MTSATVASRHFPSEPVVRYIESHYPGAIRHKGGMERESQVAILPWEICGLHRSRWAKAIERGYFTEEAADIIGEHLVNHPSLIWPEWFEGTFAPRPRRYDIAWEIKESECPAS